VEISREELLVFLEANYTGVQMANHFNCSKKVVYRRLKEESLSLKTRYASPTDEDLDITVTEMKESFPNAGSQVMHNCTGYKMSHCWKFVYM